jgi:hypothetical protein
MNNTPAAPTLGQQRLVRGRHRVAPWINTKTMEPVYGVQRQKPSGKGYVNCAIDGTALLYTSEETAAKIVRWLNDPDGTEPEWSKDSAL